MAPKSRNTKGADAMSVEELELAVQASDALTRGLRRKRPTIALHVEGEAINLPVAALHTLAEALTEMAKGHAVAVVPVAAELTTQQAADLLGISRPYLIAQLDEEAIAFRRVGKHRRIRFSDVMRYREKRDELQT